MGEENKEKEDLKPGEGSPPEQSPENKPTPAEGEKPLKKEGEEEKDPKEGEDPEENEDSQEDNPSDDEQVQEMLADGTPATKEIKVKKDKYDENADKAKLYDAFAPVLAKLQENPDLLDRLTKGEDGETVEARINRLEQDRVKDKRTETERVLKSALGVWPDLRKYWEQVKPIAESLENQGVGYAEALQRAYFAVNPDAAGQENRLIRQAEQVQNDDGTISSPQGGGTKIVHGQTDAYEMTEDDKEIARSMGLSPELYQKHAAHLKSLNL